MSEANETPTQGAPAEKTFTQSEMDAILGDRLKRERAKYADYNDLKAKAAKFDEAEAASKSELEKAVERAEKAEKALEDMKAEAAIAQARAEVAREKGVDAELLRGETREELEAHADLIKSYIEGAPKYGQVKDGGEPPAPTVTAESIKAIKDPVARVRARAEHQDLFK